MENTVTAITTSLSAGNLWAVVADAVPLIAVVTLFGLGFYLVRRAVKKLGKGKTGM